MKKTVFTLFLAALLLFVSACTDPKTQETDYASVTNLFENGYYYLGDYESYEQCSQMIYGSSAFGKASMNENPDYITHGKKSLKLEVQGSGVVWGKADPNIRVLTTEDYFQKSDFSDCDYVSYDIYNDLGYITRTKFVAVGLLSSTGAEVTANQIVMLNPGWNHVKIGTENFVDHNGDSFVSSISYFYFFFDRYEKHNKIQVYYLDNFRAHKITES